MPVLFNNPRVLCRCVSMSIGLLLFLLSLFTVDQRRSCRFYNFRRQPCVVRCQWQALLMLLVAQPRYQANGSCFFCFLSNRSNNCACAHLLFSLRLQSSLSPTQRICGICLAVCLRGSSTK